MLKAGIASESVAQSKSIGITASGGSTASGRAASSGQKGHTMMRVITVVDGALGREVEFDTADEAT